MLEAEEKKENIANANRMTLMAKSYAKYSHLRDKANACINKANQYKQKARDFHSQGKIDKSNKLEAKARNLDNQADKYIQKINILITKYNVEVEPDSIADPFMLAVVISDTFCLTGCQGEVIRIKPYLDDIELESNSVIYFFTLIILEKMEYD